MIVAAGARVSISGATPEFHTRLRATYGLAPSRREAAVPPSLAYCGREFRLYPFMRVGEAVRLFSALHARWNSQQLLADFALCNLADAFEIRRMKRAYQRALVLALSTAPEPTVLVVENAEEFDEPRTAALLQRAVGRADSALVTYAGDVPEEAAAWGASLTAADVESRPA